MNTAASSGGGGGGGGGNGNGGTAVLGCVVRRRGMAARDMAARVWAKVRAEKRIRASWALRGRTPVHQYIQGAPILKSIVNHFNHRALQF